MTSSNSMRPAIDALRAGQEALARQAWPEAQRWFEVALSREQTAEALEGLGAAAARLGDGQTAIDAYKRAYWRRQLRNDWRGAARLATRLALDFYTFQHDLSLATTWLEAAREQLDGLEPGPEHGWLALAEGHLALVVEDDAARAQAFAAEAAALSRALGLADLEQEAIALEQLAWQRQEEGSSSPSESTESALEPAVPPPVVHAAPATSPPPAAPRGRGWTALLTRVWGRGATPAARRSLVPAAGAGVVIIVLLSLGVLGSASRDLTATSPQDRVTRPSVAAAPTVAADTALVPTAGPGVTAGAASAAGSAGAGPDIPAASSVPVTPSQPDLAPSPAATPSLATPTLAASTSTTGGTSAGPLAATPSPPSPTPLSAPTLVGTDLSGEWVHNFGTLRLRQTGTRLSGTYENAFFPGPGTVEATVTGTTITGRWARDGVTGSLRWSLSPDGQTFTGSFTDEGMGDTTYQWCGARPDQPFPDGCSFAGNWVATVNEVTPCPMRLTRRNLTVTGTYCRGSVSGTITASTGALQTVLTGTWQATNGETGPMTLYLAGFDARQFQGTMMGTRSGPWCGWREGARPPTPCQWP